MLQTDGSSVKRYALIIYACIILMDYLSLSINMGGIRSTNYQEQLSIIDRFKFDIPLYYTAGSY